MADGEIHPYFEAENSEQELWEEEKHSDERHSGRQEESTSEGILNNFRSFIKRWRGEKKRAERQIAHFAVTIRNHLQIFSCQSWVLFKINNATFENCIR